MKPINNGMPIGNWLPNYLNLYRKKNFGFYQVFFSIEKDNQIAFTQSGPGFTVASAFSNKQKGLDISLKAIDQSCCFDGFVISLRIFFSEWVKASFFDVAFVMLNDLAQVKIALRVHKVLRKDISLNIPGFPIGIGIKSIIKLLFIKRNPKFYFPSFVFANQT